MVDRICGPFGKVQIMLKYLPLLLLVACTPKDEDKSINIIDEYVLAHSNCTTYAENIWLCNGITPKYIYVDHYNKSKCPRQKDEHGLLVVKCTQLKD